MVATIIGFVTLLFGASGVFGHFQASLNIIWGVQPEPGRGILGIIRNWICSSALSSSWAFCSWFPSCFCGDCLCGKTIWNHGSRHGGCHPAAQLDFSLAVISCSLR